MKLRRFISAGLVLAAGCLAETTIDAVNDDAYGANIGWVNARGDVTNGAVIGQAFCRGYIYCANVGWVHLGDGSPANGAAYSNTSATDYGVNHDGYGNLSGYAYGANIGWINFEQVYGKPKVSLSNGILSGYAWGANVGWISLKNAYASVQTVSLDPGPDTDADGIPDAWEYSHTNMLSTLSAGNDADSDGMSDKDEYLAGTDPFDSADSFYISDFLTGATADYVTWPAKAGRSYTVQKSDELSSIPWITVQSQILVSADQNKTAKLSLSPSNRFYRVLAAPPLSP